MRCVIGQPAHLSFKGLQVTQPALPSTQAAVVPAGGQGKGPQTELGGRQAAGAALRHRPIREAPAAACPGASEPPWAACPHTAHGLAIRLSARSPSAASVASAAKSSRHTRMLDAAHHGMHVQLTPCRQTSGKFPTASLAPPTHGLATGL